jgi:uncharacterized protein YjlB
MERRRFNAMLGVAGFGLTEQPEFAGEPEQGTKPEIIRFSRNGWVPNNERLPVLLYRKAIPASGMETASLFEARFLQHGWPPQWRDGVYDFHHYHSTAHEVLGFAQGHARLVLGGPNAREIEVHAGDVAILPTGTGHCKLEASADFLVIGAYPPDQNWDICRTAPSPDALQRMQRLPFPASDPITGPGGPLTDIWRTI